MAIFTGGVCRGTPTCLQPQTHGRTHKIQTLAITHTNTSCSISERLKALHRHRSPPPTPHIHKMLYAHASTSSRSPEHKHPPQSSHTAAWFTAAPAPTRTRTTSTWPLRLATYSGVKPSVCRTTHTYPQHDDGLQSSFTSDQTHQHVLLHINGPRHDSRRCISTA